MQFQKQLSKLKKLNLPIDKYAVFGSGPIAIRGIRDSKDIDVIVKQDLWRELIKKYPKENKDLIKIGLIEFSPEWFPEFKNINELIDNADVLNGIRFVKLKYVLEWKKKKAREKDKRDVKLIEKYLSKQPLQPCNL